MAGTSTYSQNFDTLATSGTTNAWTDDTTIAGWYHYSNVPAPNTNTYVADNGASNTGRLRSFGTGTATERALGSVASGTSGTVYFGVLLQNTDTGPIEIDAISYIGEQWRNGGNTSTQSLAVDYQISNSLIPDVITGTFQALSSFNFTSPIATATAAALDGNAAANRTSVSGATQLILQPGEYIMIRWADPNDAGNDHGLGIDDLTVSWKPSSGLDTTPPTATDLTPDDEGAPFIRASVDSLALVFSEHVQAGTTGPIEIKRSSDDVTVKSFAAGDVVISENTASYFFDGPSPLVSGVSYYVVLPSGAIKDLAGNNFAGYSGKSTDPGNTSWTFNVAPAPTAPTVAVNKFSGNASPDMVELLVIGTGVGGLPVDLRGMIIKDFASTMSSDNGGKYEFSTDTLWSSVPVGTLIVLTKNANTTDTTVGSGDFTLKVGLDDATYFTNLDINNPFDIANDDMVMLKQAGSGAAGTTGGIHALAGSATPGVLFTGYTGAKVLSSAGGTGVAVNNSTKSVEDFTEGSDATGAISFTPSAFGSPNSGGNRSYIASLRGTIAADGDGSASVVNVTAASPYLDKVFFDDGQTGQSAKVTLKASITDPANTLTQIKVVVPASLGTPSGATIGGPGAAGASVSVVGQEITISSAAVTATNAIDITINGLTTPVPALVTDNGAYPLTVSTAPAGGTLAPIATPPVVRVVIPISALRDVDSNGAPADGSTIVAIEGVCTEENFGTGNTQAFIQDATAGINVFSGTLISPALIRGNRYAVVGQILQFNGLTEIVPATGDVIDLGAAVQPAAEVVSIETLLASPEIYEGKLVKVLNLTKASGTWGNNNLMLEDATEATVNVRIPAGSTATTEPSYPVNVSGIWGQSDGASPYTTNYFLQPRDAGDLETGSVSDYDTWASSPSGATGGSTADPDGDGKDNAFEYAFGLNANSGGSVNPFAALLNKTTAKFSYTRRTQTLTGLTYKVYTSTTLESAGWVEDTGATQSVTGTAGDVQTVEVTLSAAAPLAAPKLFVRVVAE